MKKTATLALLLAGALSAATWYNNTKTYKPQAGQLGGMMIADLKINNSEVAYSDPITLKGIPLQDTGATSGLLNGTVIASCYDISDSAAVTDSLKIYVSTWTSIYAADGLDPQTSMSDAWDSVGNISLANEGGAMAQGVYAFSLTNKYDQYFRVKIWNLGGGAMHDSRCRVYWVRKNLAKVAQ